MRRDLVRSGRHRLNVAGDLAGGAALLLDGGRDRDRDLAHLPDGFGNAADRGHGFAGGGLHGRDLRRDFLGRLRGLVGERLHFRRHDRKTAAGIAGARRLDGGVEREQIGLGCDRMDQLDHFADLLGASRERADGGVGAFGVADRLAGDLAGARHLTGNLGHRAGEFFGGGCHRADIVGRTLRCRTDGRSPRAGVAGGSRHGLRGGLHAGGRRRHRAHDAGHAAFEVAGDAFHRRPPFGLGASLHLGFLLFKPADAHRIVLENLDGLGHRTDFVAAADTGNFAVETALGEVLHAAAELNERLGNAAADHPGDAACNQRDAENGEAEHGRDRLHLGVEVVEIGAGADEHVPAGDRNRVGEFADQRFLSGFAEFVAQHDFAIGSDAVAQFAHEFSAARVDVHAVLADLRGNRRQHGDTVHRVGEHVAVAIVEG